MIMEFAFRQIRLGLLIGLTASTLIGTVSAASPETSPAEPLVEQALTKEIQGDSAGRREALLHAIFQDSDHAPARWHNGQLNYQGNWVNYQSVSKAESSRPEIQEYLKVRENFGMLAGDHLQLANWCKDQKLFAQEYAHLITALELSGNPNNVQLRSRLGHQFINGTWMTSTEIAESVQRSQRFQSALKIWKPKLQRLSRQLRSPRSDLRNQARKEFLAINNPDLLSVLEGMFSQASPQSARLFLELLSQMELVEADAYLVRQALMSPYITVRESATQTLKSRPVETFVPELLESLHTPIQSRVRMFVGRSGIQLSHLLFSETKDVREIARHDSRVVFRNVPTMTLLIPQTARHLARIGRLEWGSLAGLVQANATRHAVEAEVLQKQLQAYAQKQTVEKANDRLEEWNSRVFAVLKEATELDLPDKPEDWWNWWNDYNQLTRPNGKPVKYTEFAETRSKVTHYPRLVRLSSCLTEGTPIWTDRGFVPIEKIRIGDRVLSKHPRTGRLAFQPVLRTTIRPEAKIINARFGSSDLSCTQGHAFWVSGKGWLKMRDIPTGSFFHTVGGFVELKARKAAEPQPTYNLVVANFHTYFVGPDMLLSHDVTFAQPVNNTVPGLSVNVQNATDPQ